MMQTAICSFPFGITLKCMFFGYGGERIQILYLSYVRISTS